METFKKLRDFVIPKLTEIETKNLDKRMNREDKEKHYTKTDV